MTEYMENVCVINERFGVSLCLSLQLPLSLYVTVHYLILIPSHCQSANRPGTLIELR